MIQITKDTLENSPAEIPLEIKVFKDDGLAPKGKTKHIVETDWLVKEAATLPPKKKKIKKTATARLP